MIVLFPRLWEARDRENISRAQGRAQAGAWCSPIGSTRGQSTESHTELSRKQEAEAPAQEGGNSEPARVTRRRNKRADLWVRRLARLCRHCLFSQTELVKVALPSKNIRNCKNSPHVLLFYRLNCLGFRRNTEIVYFGKITFIVNSSSFLIA